MGAIEWRKAPNLRANSMSPANKRDELEALIRERILRLDGAMGTMIQRSKLKDADYRGERFASYPHDVSGDPDVLVLTRPDVIRAIHDAYLDAGSDIIETDTFTA